MLLEAKTSVLIVGPKRSGTNYVHDVLAPSFIAAVNEPLGLHNDTSDEDKNPLNPWNFSSKDDISPEFGHKALKDDPYGALLTRSFIGWLNEGGKLIKETDFLQLGWLFANVHLKSIVLRRDIRDSIASFKKYDLYSKWGFDEKMEHFKRTITSTPQLNDLYYVSSMQRFEQLPPHARLAIYYSVADKEIARNTQDQDAIDEDYRDLVDHPEDSFKRMLEFIGLPWNEQTAKAVSLRTSTTRDLGPHGTFRNRNDLTTFTQILTPGEEADIRAISADFGVFLPKPKGTFSIPESQNTQKKQEATFNVSETRQEEADWVYKISFATDPLSDIKVVNQLITNRQYGHFLQWLIDHDLPLSSRGKPIFYNDRPQGNIRKVNNKILVESDYWDDPVNFVNWIGAAAYSAWVGGRLPTGEEWISAICPDELVEFLDKGEVDEQLSNAGQVYGRTLPVYNFKPNEKGIYDALGNASIWLRDNKDDMSLYERMKAGIEWNHTADRGVFPNPRPYWLGTSGLSLRPVFDDKPNLLSDDDYFQKIKEIVNLLTTYRSDTESVSRELFLKFDKLFDHE